MSTNKQHTLSTIQRFFFGINLLGATRTKLVRTRFIRLWVTTGTVNVVVADPDTAATSYRLTPANNTFSNTCPIMVNYHPGTGTTGNGIVPINTLNIVAGLYNSSSSYNQFCRY